MMDLNALTLDSKAGIWSISMDYYFDVSENATV